MRTENQTYAVVTPTYVGHFGFIKLYLESFMRFLQDPENVVFYFTISRDEEDEFKKIIKPYSKLNIRILIFEDVLLSFGISESPKALLDKYQKFSFQTLKKFYTMLYIPERYSLVLDSESMAVRNFKAKELFVNFFKAPFISGSEIKSRLLSDFNENVCRNIDMILGQNIPYWFLENFVWFYDKKILEALFGEHGSPMDIVQKVYQENEKNDRGREVGVFEIELYQAYIWKNLAKYKYSFFNIDQVLRELYSDEIYQNFLKMHGKFFGGNCGLLERVMNMLEFIPCEKLALFMREHNFNIIRCDTIDYKFYPLQKKFLGIVNPCILAASQGHGLGLNDCVMGRLKAIILMSRPANRLKKHLDLFLSPSKRNLKWMFEPLSIIYYSFLVVLQVIRYLKIIILG